MDAWKGDSKLISSQGRQGMSYFSVCFSMQSTGSLGAMLPEPSRGVALPPHHIPGDLDLAGPAITQDPIGQMGPAGGR